MAECAVCGDNTGIPYVCNYCGNSYCSQHRLPEKHACSGGTKTITNTRRTSNAPDIFGSVWRHRFKLLAIVLVSVFLVYPGFAAWDSHDSEAAAVQKPSKTPDEDGYGLTDNRRDGQKNAGNQRSTPKDALNISRTEILVHQKVNEFRVSHGKSPLHHDSDLRKIARSHSEEMAKYDFLSHESRDGSDLSDRYKQYGYECRIEKSNNEFTLGAENAGQTWYKVNVLSGGEIRVYSNESEVAEGIVRQWRTSKSHREIMLEEYWVNHGVGIATAVNDEGKTKVYVTDDFC